MQVLHQQKEWDRVGGLGHTQSAVHIASARLGCERAMVRAKWATSQPDCMDRLINTTLTL